MRLTDKDFWVENSNDEIYLDLNSDGMAEFLKKYIPKSTEKAKAFEFGIYPGNYLNIIASKGYQIYGIDYHPRLSDMLIERSKKISISNILNDDINTLKSNVNKYSLVYSIGFIEHFSNWEEILDLHVKLTEKGGTLIITCPNFRTLNQRIYHLLWDFKSYKKHYIPSMNAQKWKEILVKNDFEIIYNGYFGGTYFWNEQKNMSVLNRSLSNFYIKFILYIKSLLIVKLRSNFAFNCFCGIVAKKK